jgi:hypothetical protein
VWDLCIPTFIPSQVAYLYSSIVHYERNSMHDAVIRVYDAAGNVIEAQEGQSQP